MSIVIKRNLIRALISVSALFLSICACSKTEYAKETDGGDKPRIGGCVLKCRDAMCTDVKEISRYDKCAFDEIHLWEAHRFEEGSGQKCVELKANAFTRTRLSCREFCNDDGAGCGPDLASKCTGADGQIIVPDRCICP